MNDSGFAASALIVYAAWFACGTYFVISAFATQRIQKRESRSARSLDSLLLLGGYVLLFARLPPDAGWNQTFLAPPWAAPLAVAGTVLAVAGLAFTCWARATLGQYWSRVVAIKEDHKLVQSGPYRVVRHPLYTGLLAASLGTALCFGLWHALAGAALLWTGFISRAGREDALLAGQFGPEFAAYRARSGRLLPRLGGE